MPTPFQDILRDREYTGRPLVLSQQWPPPEGTAFVEVEAKDTIGAATVQRARPSMENGQVSACLRSVSIENAHTEIDRKKVLT